MGPLCSSRLSPTSSPLMNGKKKITGGEKKRNENEAEPVSRGAFRTVCVLYSAWKLHHRHNLCEPQLQCKAGDVWPAAFPCQMAPATPNTRLTTEASTVLNTHAQLRLAWCEKWALSSRFHLCERQLWRKSEKPLRTQPANSFPIPGSFQSPFPLHYTQH